jgi:hypothetical protein
MAGNVNCRHDEHRHGEGELTSDQASCPRAAAKTIAPGQRQHHGVTRHQAFAQQIDRQHQQHQRQGRLRRRESLDAKARQHAGQQRRGNRHRNTVHDFFKPARDAEQSDQRGADHESRNRLAHRKAAASPAVASTAAPGVDQATITGFLSHSEGTSEHSPMPMPSAHIHEAISAGVALKASAAWKTMATELVKPTRTATKPAVKAARLRSLKNCIGGFWQETVVFVCLPPVTT